MSEANRSEVDVESLMAKIQEEVRNRRAKSTLPETKKNSMLKINGTINMMPIEAQILFAENQSQVLRRLPRVLDRFPINRSKLLQRLILGIYERLFRKQRAANLALAQALRETLEVNRQLNDKIEALGMGVAETRQRIEAAEERAQGTSGQIEALGMGVAETRQCIEAAEERAQGTSGQIEALGMSVAETRQRIEAAEERAQGTSGQIEALGMNVAEISHYVETISHAAIEKSQVDIQNQLLDHKRNILDQERRIGLLLEEARKRLPGPISQQQIENMVAEEDHLLDSFYVSFEDRFRGTRADIKQRVEDYLPVVRESGAGTTDAPILDIGCGRGEWLELLKENGLVARGIDLNRVMVKQCQELELDVAECDAIAGLAKLKANSLGAVTGMHIIEHIPFKRLIALFDEVLRVLKPGGVAIFETPNPENLIVGACNFYFDPTHLNPLPPEPMRYVMEARGFSRIEVRRLHSYPDSIRLKEGEGEVSRVLNDLLYGPQDYALLAYKI